MISAFRTLALSSLAVIALLFACKKEKTVTVTQTVKDPVYFLRGNASGAQEAPNRVTTTATGTITGRYNKDSNTLNFTVTWTGLTGGNATAGHFHGPAEPGVAAGVAIGFTGISNTASGSYTNPTPITLTDAQEADLLNGLWYYNIHNAANPGGEIRGQVFLTQ